MESKCEYCTKSIETCPLTLKCCGYTVCYDHYKDVATKCPICNCRFQLDECVSMLRNEINLKIFSFKLQIENFKLLLDEFKQIQCQPETILDKLQVKDSTMTHWLNKEIESLQIDLIETKTNLFIQDTMNKIDSIAKTELVELINRRLEILKEINENFNFEQKILEYKQLKNYQLIGCLAHQIHKFDFNSNKDLIASSLDGRVDQIDKYLTKYTNITSCRTKLNVLSVKCFFDDQIICGLSDGKIRIWSIKRKKCIESIEAHKSGVCCLDIMKGDFLVSGSCGGGLKLWNRKTGHVKLVYDGHEFQINDIDRVSKGVFVTCSNDKTIKIWNLKCRNFIKMCEGHTSIVNCVRRLSEEVILSGSCDGEIRVWDLRKCNCVKILKDDNLSIMCLDIGFKGLIIAGTLDGRIKCWDSKEDKIKICIDAHESAVTCVKQSKPGFLVSCSNDKNIKLWKINLL